MFHKQKPVQLYTVFVTHGRRLIDSPHCDHSYSELNQCDNGRASTNTHKVTLTNTFLLILVKSQCSGSCPYTLIFLQSSLNSITSILIQYHRSSCFPLGCKVCWYFYNWKVTDSICSLPILISVHLQSSIRYAQVQRRLPPWAQQSPPHNPSWQLQTLQVSYI